MGKATSGIYRDHDSSQAGRWHVDKWVKGERIRRRGFLSHSEAQDWLTAQMAEHRKLHLHGKRPDRTFDEAAAKHILENPNKLSLDLDIYLLGLVMPFIGHLEIGEIDQEAIDKFVEARLRKPNRKKGPLHGRGKDKKLAAKTVNLAIGLVSSILNKAAREWKHDKNTLWLDHAPMLKQVSLDGLQRAPTPITWAEQSELLAALPVHLQDMLLFCTNTGVRDNVACKLQWEWEMRIPELDGRSIFNVPKEYVKGRAKDAVIVCNSAAQEVIERCRGKHPDFVFVYRRERIKNFNAAPAMPYRPVQTMNNTAWQTARDAAELHGLHVHDLRHTFAIRLREAAVPPETRRVLLWHGDLTVTDLYTVAQLVEMAEGVEKVARDAGRWNRTIGMLKREQYQSRKSTFGEDVKREHDSHSPDEREHRDD